MRLAAQLSHTNTHNMVINSTCHPISPPSLIFANSFVIGTAVINTHIIGSPGPRLHVRVTAGEDQDTALGGVTADVNSDLNPKSEDDNTPTPVTEVDRNTYLEVPNRVARATLATTDGQTVTPGG